MVLAQIELILACGQDLGNFKGSTTFFVQYLSAEYNLVHSFLSNGQQSPAGVVKPRVAGQKAPDVKFPELAN